MSEPDEIPNPPDDAPPVARDEAAAPAYEVDIPDAVRARSLAIMGQILQHAAGEEVDMAEYAAAAEARYKAMIATVSETPQSDE